jgi:Protein of unknown function (DUF2950)
MMLERNNCKKIQFGRLGTLSTLGRLWAWAFLAGGFAFCANGTMAQTSAKPPAPAGQKSAIRSAAGPQAGQETFASAKDASKALISALQTNDQEQLLKVLGPNAKDIVYSGDENADKEERQQIAEKYGQMHRLVTEPDGTTTLYIGAENWPTPIPLMRKGKEWYFDSAAGKQAILYRRIGRNELAILQVCSELVDAEKEYYGQAHDGESANRYAEKFISDDGKHNGLYWKAGSGGPESPIGPLVAAAAADDAAGGSAQGRQPFDGYYFRMLQWRGAPTTSHSQGFAAAGANDGGFAFVAYPAKYRSSGVMTFLVNQDGVIYEKDLGRETEGIATKLKSYRRDASWRKAD